MRILPSILSVLLFTCSATLLADNDYRQRKDDPNEAEPDKLVDAKTKKAIERGLKFLARKQIKTGNVKGGFGQGGYAGGVATCGLGGLAFMCNGSAPGEGK